MAYTKLTDFAAKDALLTGNPSKLIKGVDIGAEFDAIAADAIAIRSEANIAGAGNTALTSVGGTANAITATGSSSLSAYASGQIFRFVPASTNTSATTINITGGSALGAKNIYWNGAALLGGEILANVPLEIVYDGTQFHILSNSRGMFTAGVAQTTTSGTSKDYTGIPAGVGEIHISLVGVGTNGTSLPIIQIGDSGGIESTGYVGCASNIINASATVSTNYGSGILLAAAFGASSVISGTLILTHYGSGVWTANGAFGFSDTAANCTTAGHMPLSTANLDRLRLTTVNGTDTFDAGAWNIRYR